MRSRTSEWFECKVQYEKVMEDGMQKKVTELYTVEALSFTEAEARIIEEMSAYINGEYEVKDIKKAKYKEIWFSDDENAEKQKRRNLYRCGDHGDDRRVRAGLRRQPRVLCGAEPKPENACGRHHGLRGGRGERRAGGLHRQSAQANRHRLHLHL